MRQIVLIAASLVISAGPCAAEEFKWLSEDQFQNMSIDELQKWAKQADKNLARPSKFKRKSDNQVADTTIQDKSTTIELRKELPGTTTITVDKDPNDIDKSYMAKPKYFSDAAGGVKKVVGAPFNVTGGAIKGTFKFMEKCMWFLDEKVPWL